MNRLCVRGFLPNLPLGSILNLVCGGDTRTGILLGPGARGLRLPIAGGTGIPELSSRGTGGGKGESSLAVVSEVVVRESLPYLKNTAK